MAMQLTSNNLRVNGEDDPRPRVLDDLQVQFLRILRCTAVAFSIEPSRLCVSSGSRPWLDALCDHKLAN
jgi:hypothetical protein